MVKLGFRLTNDLLTPDFPVPDIEHLATLPVAEFVEYIIYSKKGNYIKTVKVRLPVASYPGKQRPLSQNESKQSFPGICD